MEPGVLNREGKNVCHLKFISSCCLGTSGLPMENVKTLSRSEKKSLAISLSFSRCMPLSIYNLNNDMTPESDGRSDMSESCRILLEQAFKKNSNIFCICFLLLQPLSTPFHSANICKQNQLVYI